MLKEKKMVSGSSIKNTPGVADSDERFNTKILAQDVIIKDLVGSEDWKKSKIGYLTGASVIKRSVNTIGSTTSESFGRLTALSSSIFSRNYVEPTPREGSDHERFQMSMLIHNRTEQDLITILNNTYKSAILYSCLSLVSLFLGLVSLYTFSPRDIVDILTRFIPLYIVCPLLFQHAYTNWIVRTRQLGSILSFIKSRNWYPKK